MNITGNSSLEVDMVNENDELQGIDSEKSFSNKELSSKRDIRSEIEKKLEMLELKKLTGDSVYDELFWLRKNKKWITLKEMAVAV